MHSSLIVMALVITLPPGPSGEELPQDPPVRVLERIASLTDGATDIGAVLELTPDSVLFIDVREHALRIGEFSTGRAVQIGRTGDGPGEYRGPDKVWPIGDGSALVNDAVGRRLILVAPDLALSSLSPWGTIGPPLTTGATLSRVEGADVRGYLYGRGETDRERGRAPIERWSLGSFERDTVAHLPVTISSRARAGAAGGVSVGALRRPFQGGSRWTVCRDGTVAILTSEPFRLEFVDPVGRRTLGPDVPYTPIPLSEEHKGEWRESEAEWFLRRMAIGTTVVITRDGSVPPPGLPPGVVVDPPSWPEELPPWDGDDALRCATDDRVWVQRTTPARAPARFDVFDYSGALVDRVELPEGMRLVGFGAGVVYLVRRDEFDLEYLERYRLAG